jgi:hypothetical protein
MLKGKFLLDAEPLKIDVRWEVGHMLVKSKVRSDIIGKATPRGPRMAQGPGCAESQPAADRCTQLNHV